MRRDPLRRLLIAAVVAAVAIAAIGARSLVADANASGCGIQHASTGGGCTMGAETHSKDHSGCAMLTGKVVAVGKNHGSVTVTLVPARSGDQAAARALSGIKAGDTLSLAVVLAAGKTARNTAKYACPMHPEVASDRPGTCPKCNMKLEPAGAGQK